MADKGIVLFYDWLDVLKDIPPQEFKKMVLAIAEFRQNNTPPPTFNGKAKYIAPLIFGQLKTSKQKSSAGKLGAQGKWALSENSANGTSDGTPNGNANGRPAPCANSNANDQEQEQEQEQRTISNNIPPLPPKGQEAPFADQIAAYAKGDKEIEDLLTEWLKVRKAKRAAMTERAIQLNLQKLDSTARDSGMSVPDYLREVICRGWQAFYVIRDYAKPERTGGNIFLDLVKEDAL